MFRSIIRLIFNFLLKLLLRKFVKLLGYIFTNWKKNLKLAYTCEVLVSCVALLTLDLLNHPLCSFKRSYVCEYFVDSFVLRSDKCKASKDFFVLFSPLPSFSSLSLLFPLLPALASIAVFLYFPTQPSAHELFRSHSRSQLVSLIGSLISILWCVFWGSRTSITDI